MVYGTTFYTSTDIKSAKTIKCCKYESIAPNLANIFSFLVLLLLYGIYGSNFFAVHFSKFTNFCKARVIATIQGSLKNK